MGEPLFIFLFFFSFRAGQCLLLPPSNLPSDELFRILPGAAGLFWARTGRTRRYRLPSLLKHGYMALCFIAQSSYEKAAKMRITPTPDVVTCVFMLFCRICPDNVVLWAPAAAHTAAEDGACSGRMPSVLMRWAHPIKRCSKFWSGAGWK